jgi:hypothetical protein
MDESIIHHFTDAIIDVCTRQTLVEQHNHSGLAFFTKPLAKNDYFRMRDILMSVPSADRIADSRERKTL